MFGFGKKKQKTSAPTAGEAGSASSPSLFGRLFGSDRATETTPPEPPVRQIPSAPQATPQEAPSVAPEPSSQPPLPERGANRLVAPVEMPEELPDLADEEDWTEAGEQRGGLLHRLRERLGRTRANLGDGLGALLLGRQRIDTALLEDLETLLISADVGVEASTRIIGDLSERVRRKTLTDPSALIAALKAELAAILARATGPVRQPAPGRPQVILMVGVNGAGKTTTIGKLAKRLQEEGNSVMLAAGDTFRAAAIEQLQVWGERNHIPVIAQQSGADSASVIFDALQAATARGVDVLIADTAGRLHTKSNLMDELTKVARVMKKIDPEAPHEVMLVVDATTGQNALHQAEHFHRALGLTGITLTKLDGTAKGGIVFAIAERLGVPIRFIGIGESIEDLRYFEAEDFIEALFD